MGPVPGVGCPVYPELPSVTVTMSWKQGTMWGNLFSTLLCQGDGFGLPEPMQGLGKGKAGSLPALSQSGRINPVFCHPFHGEHIHGSNSSWEPAQLSPLWGPPGALGPSRHPWVGALGLLAHSQHQETQVCAAGGAFAKLCPSCWGGHEACRVSPGVALSSLEARGVE